MNGNGILKHQNGDYYEGEFVNDKKEGRGAISYPDGSKYDGGWYHNK